MVQNRDILISKAQSETVNAQSRQTSNSNQKIYVYLKNMNEKDSNIIQEFKKNKIKVKFD